MHSEYVTWSCLPQEDRELETYMFVTITVPSCCLIQPDNANTFPNAQCHMCPWSVTCVPSVFLEVKSAPREIYDPLAYLEAAGFAQPDGEVVGVGEKVKVHNDRCMQGARLDVPLIYIYMI